ncbi:hydroxyacid dehydrogenase [Pseudorhodobacter sp.]|uniref:hydroxyacid dehydrogenase n=1 Tax=Pseudorhodobacter sp. TaxID=1934400 RepID=UPI0026498B34|nr:hydroxyacid dehydrogenase [Pseudorhodobacter sp.]MDN5788797.1 hydroxyacid dehydrogenase [Pseudorhodobacter sp.]
MKCLIVQPIHEAGIEALKQAGIEPVLCPAPDMETVARHIAGADAVITRDAGLNAAAFAAADRLRVVIVHGTGHDPVDKQAAARAGVVIANTPGVNARSVAELAVGLSIAVARRIPAADKAVRCGRPGFRESARFTELSGKTALVVGWGAIGRETGRMLAQAFDMRVLVYSPRSPQVEGGHRITRLADGLAQADLVALHTPLRDETRNLMDAAAIGAMKPGAILINLARAGLVDEDALLAALLTGQLGGAGLDVYSAAAPQGPLAAFENVIFTPHIGGTTEDALRRVALEAVHHVKIALSGHLPETALNPEVWSPQE